MALGYIKDIYEKHLIEEFSSFIREIWIWAFQVEKIWIFCDQLELRKSLFRLKVISNTGKTGHFHFLQFFPIDISYQAGPTRKGASSGVSQQNASVCWRVLLQGVGTQKSPPVACNCILIWTGLSSFLKSTSRENNRPISEQPLLSGQRKPR